ncbi:MAG: autoinducer binding domain-containing protein [Rhodothalassiaceae bacterium]
MQDPLNLDFLDALGEPDLTLEHLIALFERSLAHIGAERFAYLHFRPHREPLAVSNYPPVWLAHYVGQGYLSRDPAIPVDRHLPFVWHHRQAIWSAAQCQIMNEAADVGLRSGVTVPMGLDAGFPRMFFASIACANSRFDSFWQDKRRDILALAHVFKATVDERFSESVQQVASLPPREQECLLWAARGKTSWEIGQLMGITERTVNAHFARTMTRFGVHSRTEAVVRAILGGLIAP